MGIFTRFRDIVSSNISSMLDQAEDPEKMIKLMISEMEDTLIELKSSCAGVIAGQKKISRKLDEIFEKKNLWADRANLAVAKGRDDLARGIGPVGGRPKPRQMGEDPALSGRSRGGESPCRRLVTSRRDVRAGRFRHLVHPCSESFRDTG